MVQSRKRTCGLGWLWRDAVRGVWSECGTTSVRHPDRDNLLTFVVGLSQTRLSETGEAIFKESNNKSVSSGVR